MKLHKIYPERKFKRKDRGDVGEKSKTGYEFFQDISGKKVMTYPDLCRKSC